MKRTLLLIGLIAAAVSLRTPTAAADASVTIAVVVSEDSRMRELSRTELRRIFLRDSSRHSDLIPLNLDAQSPIRTAFDQTILGMSLEQDTAARLGSQLELPLAAGAPELARAELDAFADDPDLAWILVRDGRPRPRLAARTR
jgi:hypothetical protein